MAIAVLWWNLLSCTHRDLQTMSSLVSCCTERKISNIFSRLWFVALSSVIKIPISLRGEVLTEVSIKFAWERMPLTPSVFLSTNPPSLPFFREEQVNKITKGRTGKHTNRLKPLRFIASSQHAGWSEALPHYLNLPQLVHSEMEWGVCTHYGVRAMLRRKTRLRASRRLWRCRGTMTSPSGAQS